MDEVQAGIARTGEFLGYQKSGTKPHAIAMAKGLGGGFPIGAIWVDRTTLPTIYSGQPWNNLWRLPLGLHCGSCSARCYREENLIEQAKTNGEEFKIGLQNLATQFPQKITEIKGRGLMLGLGLTFDPSLLVAQLRENGLIAVGAARNTLRLLPPLTVKE